MAEQGSYWDAQPVEDDGEAVGLAAVPLEPGRADILDVSAAAKLETGTGAAAEKPAPTDGKKPEARSKAKAKKPAKKDDALGKGMTLDEMEAKREALRAEAKSWTDAIDKRKREEKAKEEKAKRLQEQRDALEFYRKYREYIEAAKRLTLKSGMTVFEYIEREVMRGRNG